MKGGGFTAEVRGLPGEAAVSCSNVRVNRALSVLAVAWVVLALTLFQYVLHADAGAHPNRKNPRVTNGR